VDTGILVLAAKRVHGLAERCMKSPDIRRSAPVFDILPARFAL
jgi:hypothetical protein